MRTDLLGAENVAEWSSALMENITLIQLLSWMGWNSQDLKKSREDDKDRENEILLSTKKQSFNIYLKATHDGSKIDGLDDGTK